MLLIIFVHPSRPAGDCRPETKYSPRKSHGNPLVYLHTLTPNLPITQNSQQTNATYSCPRATSVRNADQFYTYQLLSASSRTPLITLWTASWCPTCRTVEPLVQGLVESGVGQAEGGVGYCTVEFDAPDVMASDLGLTYMIRSLPTLLSFDAQEAQVSTKVTDGRRLADRSFLEEWIRNEARRQGRRGGG